MVWACRSAFLGSLEILAVIFIALNSGNIARKEWSKIVIFSFASCSVPHPSSAFRIKPVSVSVDSHDSSKSPRSILTAELSSHISAAPNIAEQAILAFMLKADKATQLVELSLQMIEVSRPE